MDQDIDLL